MIKENYIDLHTHTTCSDGTLTPTQLVAKAKEINLSAVAITDHDCVAGIAEAVACGKELGVEVISGIELAAYYHTPKETEIHIVGLFVDHTHPKLLAKTKEILEERKARNIKMTEALTALGCPMTYEDLIAESNSESCTRAHYANIMVKKGYVRKKKDAFQKYIGHGKPGFVPRLLPTPEACINIIKESGGIAVLAHPTLYGLNYSQITKMATALKALGLGAIETMYATYNHEQQREITKIANSLNLLHCGGSDFHGTNKEGIRLGVGTGKLNIPYSIVEEIKLNLK